MKFGLFCSHNDSSIRSHFSKLLDTCFLIVPLVLDRHIHHKINGLVSVPNRPVRESGSLSVQLSNHSPVRYPGSGR